MHHVCPKGGGEGGISAGHHADGDDIDDNIESEKMALLKKWPQPVMLPQPPSETDESERRESIDAPSSIASAKADQNMAHVLLLQQQQPDQKALAISKVAMGSPDDGVSIQSLPETDKQRYRKARDPKKRALNAAMVYASFRNNDEVGSVTSPEEEQGQQNVQTEPEDLSNKDSIEQKSNSP